MIETNLPPRPARAPSVHNGLSITGFVLAFFLPLIGFILSWVAIGSAHRDGRKASGLAVAGMIIGGIVTVIVIIVVIAAVHSASSSTNEYLNCINGQLNGTVPLSTDCNQYGFYGG